jgi:hypothetical protein
VNLRDAQDNPGNGPGDGLSAASPPPSGSQTSVRVFARMAGDPVTEGSPSEAAHNVLKVDG